MARTINLSLDQSFDFRVNLPAIKDSSNATVDVTSATFTASMKTEFSSVSSISLNVAKVAPATNGIIQLFLLSSSTIGINPGRYVYDVRMVLSGVASKVFQGFITVNPAATEI